MCLCALRNLVIVQIIYADKFIISKFSIHPAAAAALQVSCRAEDG